MIPTFIMLIGLPGSGKSTYAKYLDKIIDCEILSSDAYRKIYLGDENNQSNNELVFRHLNNDVKEYLKQGRNVVYDATNISYKSRKQILEYIKDINCIKKAAVINTPIEICIEHDRNRDRTVGERVINKMVKSFEFPQYFEGFTSIYLIHTNEYRKYNSDKIRQQMNNYNQNNPHHDFTVGEHCKRVGEILKDNFVLHEAGKWHDVGKMFTQTTDDKNISHYINHANYSAYWLCSHTECTDFKYPIDFYNFLFYVNQHMHIRDIVKSEKAPAKYKFIWGEDKYNNLIRFMEADNKGAKKMKNK